MPRTSRKRNNRRNESTVRVNSNLSPNAPEFIPIANDETSDNQRENVVIQSMTFCGSSSTSNSSGSHSNSNYETTTTISTIPDKLKNEGQRDLLINLLNESKVDCVICYERVKNVEPTWNCRNCYQIMHLKCIIVWFIKSHSNAVWRCPACQCQMIGKPKYICFCGTLPNPYHNNVDTPHSCGQVCGLQRKNANLNYNDCHHKCTLLCHPGPCPQCVVQVLRSCACGKKREYARCGQSTQIVCNNVCLKKLNCQIHECQKICHANECDPCNKGCSQNLNPRESTLIISNESFADAILQYNMLPPESVVTEEELRMLGLNPEEIFEQRNVQDSYYSASSNNFNAARFLPYNNEINIVRSDESENSDDFEVDDIDDMIIQDFGYRRNSDFPVVLSNPISGYSGSREFEIVYPMTDDDDYDDDDDDDEEDDEDDEDDTGEEEEDDDDDEEDNEGCASNNYYDAHEYDTNHSWADSSSDEGREVVSSSPMDSEQSDSSLDTNDTINTNEIHLIAGTNSTYSEDSTDSSQSSISDSSDSNSSSGSSSISSF